MSRLLAFLTLIIILLSILVSSIGLFYNNAGEPYYVESVRGDIEIFGQGLYEHESYFKAPILIGTDAAILFIVVPFYVITLYFNKKNTVRLKILNIGLLSCLLYYSASLAFGVSYNILFLVYLILFSACLFTFIFEFNNIDMMKFNESLKPNIPHKSTALFLFIAGLSVFVWLIEIISSIKSGKAPESLGLSTTEPTFILDLGIIAPLAFSTSYLVYKKRPLGYLLSMILLTLNVVVGVIVIFQTVFQNSYGVGLKIDEFIPYVMVFALMSIFATYLLVKTYRNINVS